MPTPQDQTLEEQYEQVIFEQKEYLSHLQSTFNAHCDEIANKTAEQLKNVPENDKKTRTIIFTEQKQELNESLALLKKNIEKNTMETRNKLEDINVKREARELKELEDTIQHMENTTTSN